MLILLFYIASLSDKSCIIQNIIECFNTKNNAEAKAFKVLVWTII